MNAALACADIDGLGALPPTFSRSKSTVSTGLSPSLRLLFEPAPSRSVRRSWRPRPPNCKDSSTRAQAGRADLLTQGGVVEQPPDLLRQSLRITRWHNHTRIADHLGIAPARWPPAASSSSSPPPPAAKALVQRRHARHLRRASNPASSVSSGRRRRSPGPRWPGRRSAKPTGRRGRVGHQRQRHHVRHRVWRRPPADTTRFEQGVGAGHA